MEEFINTVLGQPPLTAVAICLALGLVAYLFSRIAPLVSFLCVLAAALGVAYAAFVMNATGLLTNDIRLFGDGISLGPVSLSLNFSSTFLGALVVGGSVFFTVLIAIYCAGYLAKTNWQGKAYAYMTWALAGCCLVGWAGSFLVLLLGWELVTLMLYLLLNPGTRGSEAGAAKTLGLLGFTDQCLLLAVVLMIAVSPSLDPAAPMHNLQLPSAHLPVNVGSLGWMGYAIYALLLIAALAKAGAMPLHSWIPAAAEHSSAPIMALLPGALDKLLGIYLLARVTLDVFVLDWTFQVVLMCIGAVTILAAVFMAMIQHNLKKLLSFHAVSQVGYMVLGIATGTVAGIVGGLLHMLNHAIYKSNLFLMSGSVGKAAGSDEIENMGGLARQLPVTFACGLVSAAAISGVPPFNGFVSKWLIYQGCLDLHSGLGATMLVAAVFGSALTVASFVKIIYAAFLSPKPPGKAGAPPVKESFLMAAPMVVLALACVALGLYPQPVVHTALMPIVESVHPTAERVVDTAGMSLQVGKSGLWYPSAALGLIVIGLVLGLAVPAMFALKRKVRIVRPFYSGEILDRDDRFRMPGTAFYETVKSMRGVGPLLEQGARGSMDVYHMAGRYGQSLIDLLRAQHTGLICLYAAWCFVGLAATVVYLLITGIR